MKRFGDLPEIVLDPLKDRPDADWQVAPPGAWTPAQIVEHLALALEWSATGFEERRARDPMTRRPSTVGQRVAKVLVMDFGWFPPFLKAPSRSTPAPHVDRAAAEAHFRRGVERIEELANLLLPARGRDLFVKHVRLGDLTLPEWMEFHVIHARHHARQIRARLRR
jgi:uncharacterized protein DUF1569